MPFIDTPDGRFEGTQAQIDAYRTAMKAAANPSRSAVTPNTPDDSPDTTTGADFMTRVGASFKMTPEGKAGFYRDKYGDGNVAIGADGELRFRKDARSRWTVADESALTLKDLADFAGDAPGALLSALGGLGGTVAGVGVGSVPGAAIGAAAGNALKQNISNLLPGNDNMTPLSRVVDMAKDATLGGVSQKVTNGAVALRDMVRPQNVVARTAGQSVARPDTQAVLQASTDTGIPLTTSEATGSKNLRALEDYSRRVPFVADKYQAFDKLQSDKAVERINGIMRDLSTDGMDRENYGTVAQRAFNKVLDDAIATRRGAAARDFGEVTRLGGKGVTIPVTQTREAMLRVAEQFDAPGGGDATAALVRQIRSAADELGSAARPDQFNRLLQIYGKAAAGKGTVFKDLDSAQQRYVAGEVHSALTRDLDVAAQVGNVVRSAGGDVVARGDAAAALKAARDNYAKNSAEITKLGDSVLGGYFETKASRTPEYVADKIRRMPPSEIRATLGILSQADPEMAEKTASHFMQTALDKATADNTQFSAAKFLKALPPEPAQEALLGGKPALGEIRKVAQVLERVRDKPAEGSQTAGRFLTAATIGGTAGTAVGFFLNPVAAAGATASAGSILLTSNAIAKAMLTSKGRDALMRVATTGPTTKAVTQAASYLTALSLTEQKASTDAAIATAGSGAAR